MTVPVEVGTRGCFAQVFFARIQFDSAGKLQPDKSPYQAEESLFEICAKHCKLASQEGSAQVDIVLSCLFGGGLVNNCL